MSPRLPRTKDLETRLRAVYAFILAYKAAHDGNAPTMKEIGLAVVGTPATSLASFYLDHLESRKMIERRDGAICIPNATWTPPGA